MTRTATTRTTMTRTTMTRTTDRTREMISIDANALAAALAVDGDSP